MNARSIMVLVIVQLSDFTLPTQNMWSSVAVSKLCLQDVVVCLILSSSGEGLPTSQKDL